LFYFYCNGGMSMRWYRRYTQEMFVPVKIECDRCHKEYENTGNECLEYQEFVCIFIDGGYGSIFGDGSQLQCHLCQHCAKILFGEYLREAPEENENLNIIE